MPPEPQSYDSVSEDYFAKRDLLGIIWFARVGQNRLVLAPEEAFAVEVSRR